MNRLSIATVAVVILAAGCTSSGGSSTGGGPSAGSPAETASSSTKPSSSVEAANIKVYADCGRPSVKPSQIVLACADHGELFVHLGWTTWATHQATAIGTFRYNDCTPDCAEGHFHEVRNVHVTLFAPVDAAGGQRVWSRVRMRPTVDHFPSVQSLPVRPD